MSYDATKPSMTDADWTTAFANMRENFRALAQFDAGVHSMSGDMKLEITTTGTTTTASIAVRSGNGTTSARKACLTVESLETSPQKYLVGMNGTTQFVIRNSTAAVDCVTIDTTGNITSPSGVTSFGPGGTGASNVMFNIDAGSGAGGYAYLLLRRNAVAKASIAVAGAAAQFSPGAAANDMVVRAAQKMIFTANDGVSDHMSIDSVGNVVLGSAAISTSATDGFLYVVTCAGTPSGTPSAKTGRVPMVYDTTNNKLYVYNGAWKSVTLA